MNTGLAILISILALLVMIYLSTRSIVQVLNHWGRANDNRQSEILDKLKYIDSNTSNLIK